MKRPVFLNQFPNDRINNFCDAVFAIAMTLLILEIKIPSAEDIYGLGTLGSLKKLIPNFIGFTISFFVVALYWRSHLTIAKFIKVYDNQFLWLTLCLLFFIVLLPFSTALYSKYGGVNGPFIFYCINLVSIGFMNYWLIVMMIRKHGFDNNLTKEMASHLKIRAMIPTLVWLLSAIWVFVEPFSARFMFVFIFVFLAIADRRQKNRQGLNEMSES